MRGNEEFNKNLTEAFKKMKKGMIKGLRLGVALVKSDSVKRAPVDEGNLKSSHYTSFQINKDNAVGEIGLTAKYAAAVHEITDPSSGVRRSGRDGKGNYWDTGEPKFLENAIEDNKDNVMKLIHKHSKL